MLDKRGNHWVAISQVTEVFYAGEIDKGKK